MLVHALHACLQLSHLLILLDPWAGWLLENDVLRVRFVLLHCLQIEVHFHLTARAEVVLVRHDLGTARHRALAVLKLLRVEELRILCQSPWLVGALWHPHSAERVDLGGTGSLALGLVALGEAGRVLLGLGEDD